MLSLGTLVMTDCTISDNTADALDESKGYGGGLYATGATTIFGSRFLSNTADAGGGVFVHTAEKVYVGNSLVAKNTVTEYGGGILAWNLEMVNSTLADNTAMYGGGLFADFQTENDVKTGGTVTLDNCIVAKNAASTEGTDVFNNGDYAVIQGHYNISTFTDWATGTSGANKVYEAGSALFLDALNGDYRPSGDSLVVDGGGNAYALDADGNAMTTDLAGENRFYSGVTDIGAFEFTLPKFEISLVGFEGLYNGVAQGSIAVSGLQAGTRFPTARTGKFTRRPFRSGRMRARRWFMFGSSVTAMKHGTARRPL